MMESVELEDTFEAILSRTQRGVALADTDARFAIGAICIPVMLGSSARPGALINMKQTEFQHGRIVDGIYLVNVADHKTNQSGSARLLFEEKLLRQAELYRDHIRPLMIACDAWLKANLQDFQCIQDC